jgi:putative peptidoglycan lipid II flippase
VLGFAARAGYLEFDKALVQSLLKFLASGVVLAAALWFAAKFAGALLAQMPVFRDETVLLVLIAVGAIVYGASILLLFGKGWLRSLVRS